MDDFVKQITTIAMAIVGVGIIAVLVSKNANTSQVIQSTGQAFSQSLATAVSPVTGSNGMMGFSY
jgi:hypothetical protein